MYQDKSGEDNTNRPLNKSTLWLMTIGAGLVVANNYYNQPLLGMIAQEFGVTDAVAGRVATTTLAGYAIGLFLLVPLGDMFHKKRIIICDFVLIILSLLSFAFSTNIIVMTVSSFFIGLSSVVPQMFVPLTAQLSSPKERNKNIGIVMSGLLIGILGSRVLSGVLGEYAGWRTVFYMATAMMFVLWLLVIYMLPETKPSFKGTYGSLIRSLGELWKELPGLRLASLMGALSLASFQVFWTTLAFHLEGPPFFAGSDIAGELGLVGIGGALAATFTGRIADKINKKHLITAASLLMLISWVLFGLWGFSYCGLIAGIFILDIGLQSLHITNQTIIYASKPAASNRLNTVYMTCYFVGGAFGSFVAGKTWVATGWTGVVLSGAVFAFLLSLSNMFFRRKDAGKTEKL